MAKSEPNTPKEFAWVGRELVRILNKAPDGTVRDLFQLIQDRGGPTLLGDLMNALRDCDVTTLPKVTREVTPERKEALKANLVKAREAKKKKKGDIWDDVEKAAAQVPAYVDIPARRARSLEKRLK